ncbi:histidine kinase [Halobacteria archaeon AArc-curdl1]|uniref:Histidine kinase n=1 Tax=Natronosalvus hydrolyticus TaxID=2979988 RepID=A0AAP2ZAQ7_9EURY|nr:histidine kinase [Halobacteria archaeon AArc-curdl1]
MSFQRVFEWIRQNERTLEVHTRDPDRIADLEATFGTYNVTVSARETPPQVDDEFVLVRDSTGSVQGVVGCETLEAILSPTEAHLRFEPTATREEMAVFDFLDNTMFRSSSRRQLLAITRELEERAWRTNGGNLYVGFQRSGALEAQRELYERFEKDREVAVNLYIRDDWHGNDSFEVNTVVADEIATNWFVIFDGGPGGEQRGALVARERSPAEYDGFWTHDRVVLETLIDTLESLESVVPEERD